MKLRIRTKVALLVFAVGFVCAGTVGVFSFISARSHMHRIMDVEYKTQVHLLKKGIDEFLKYVKRDLIFLTRIPPVRGIIRAKDHNGFDPVEKKTYEQWAGELGVIFREFAVAEKDYMQVRLIDESGREIARVDYDGELARIVPQHQLQDKSSRYYFKEGMKLSRGEIYISGIDLNRENGHIQVPLHPTLRYVAPVFNTHGKVRALLVLNVLAHKMLHISPMKIERGVENLFIVDQEGFYLRNCRDSSKEWGGPRDLGTGENLVKDYPDVATRILSEREGLAWSGETAVIYSGLNVSDTLFLIAGLEVPRSILEAPLARFKTVLIYVMAGILCLTWVLSAIFSDSILGPLQTLEKGFKKVSRGDFTLPIQIKSGDEIEDLALHFNDMVAALKKKRERLTKLYELGTATGKSSTEISDMIASAAASVLNMGIAGVGKIEDGVISFVSFYDNGRITHGGSLDLRGTACEDVVEEKKPVWFHDASERFPGAPLLQEHRINTYMGIPILSSKDDVIGIISVMDGRKLEIHQEDIELLYTLSRRIAFEWEQEARLNQIELSNQRLEALFRLSSSLSRSLDPHEMLQKSLGMLVETHFLNIRAEGLVFLLDDQGGFLRPAAHIGFSGEPEYCSDHSMPGECLCGRAVETGEVQLCTNSEQDPRHTCGISGAETHADISVPLKSKDRVFGVLHLHRVRDTVFSGEEKEFFGTVGNLIGVALENALLFRKIRRQSEDLENKVQERTEELEKALRAADTVSKAKSDFLSGMSHELRTPLNAIIGFSEVLRDQYFGALNHKQAEYVSDILESGKHLLSLINDILDLSKVEAGKMELDLSEVKIGDLVEQSLVMIKEKAYKHGIDLNADIPDEIKGLFIKADARKVKQVMFNLLSNAVKFTPEGGNVRVSVGMIDCRSALEQSGKGGELVRDSLSFMEQSQCVEIRVEDTGIGIEPEQQERIFDEFYQVKGGIADKTPGTGLGLGLTKRLIEMHGGAIWVESQGRGKGSRFSFVLPVESRPLGIGRAGLEADRTVRDMMNDEMLWDHIERAIGQFGEQRKGFSLCRLYAHPASGKDELMAMKDALEKEKRPEDLLRVHEDGSIYLILLETDGRKAEIVCERLLEKMKNMLEGREFLFAVASFPENGESTDALLRKMAISKH